MNEESLLQFPCEFVLKIFGMANEQFEVEVLSIVRKHVQDLRENAIKSRVSKDGKYLALTITITAESKDQLDTIYKDLSASTHVLMAI